MTLEDTDFLCNGWRWDPVLRELSKHARKGKRWQEKPEATERLPPVRSVTWHRWSQAPMATSTGARIGPVLCRIVAAYAGGGDLTINEPDRECAGKLAQAIAEAYGLEVIEEGAPGGRRGGNLPTPDEMGRLASRAGGTEAVFDPASGEIVVAEPKRPFGTKRRRISTREVHLLELEHIATPPLERFTVWAVTDAGEGDRVPLALYEGYEGWADPEEWRRFTEETARSLGVEAKV